VRRFADLLRAGNERTNLTRITDEAELVEKHVLDALLGLPLLPPGPLRLVDVGAGAGVPGIPLALARPDLAVTLCEAASRKTVFLAEARVALGLEARLHVETTRAETLGRRADARESFDVAVARAVGPVATCLELMLPLLRLGGRALLYRGPSDAEAEDATAATVAPLLGGGPPRIVHATLPSGAGRRFVIVEKVAPTAERYPRRDGVPANKPLS
jgi:16S rRNA (guanine527-N7)-methyltransferase